MEIHNPPSFQQQENDLNFSLNSSKLDVGFDQARLKLLCREIRVKKQLQEEIVELKRHQNELETELNSYKNDGNEGLKTKLDYLLNDNMHLENEVQSLRSDLEKSQNLLILSDKRISTLKDTKTELEENIKELIAEEVALNKAYDKLMRQSMKMARSFKSEGNLRVKRYGNAENKNQMIDYIKDLKKQLDESENKVKKLESHLDLKTSKLNSLSSLQYPKMYIFNKPDMKIESNGLKLENTSGNDFANWKSRSDSMLLKGVQDIDGNGEFQLLCEKAITTSEILSRELEQVKQENHQLKMKNLELVRKFSN